MSDVARFFEKVKYSDDCWEWDGAITNSGYGTFWSKGRLMCAHRWSYEYFIGEILLPEICHHCDNRKCVNPFHLFNGSKSDNMIDASEKKRHPNNKKTHCKYGHKLEDRIGKSYINVLGNQYRYCRTCNKKFQQKYRDKIKHLAELGEKE